MRSDPRMEEVMFIVVIVDHAIDIHLDSLLEPALSVFGDATVVIQRSKSILYVWEPMLEQANIPNTKP